MTVETLPHFTAPAAKLWKAIPPGNQLQKLLLIAIVFALSACAAFVPKEHLITKERLESTLQKPFPLHREKGVLSITLGIPQLSLIHEKNRLQLAGTFTANAVLLKTSGNFEFSSALRYDSGQRAIFLQEAQFDSLQIKHVNNVIDGKLRSLINQRIKELILVNPIYRFQPDELLVFGEKIDITEIKITSDGFLLKIRTVQ